MALHIYFFITSFTYKYSKMRGGGSTLKLTVEQILVHNRDFLVGFSIFYSNVKELYFFASMVVKWVLNCINYGLKKVLNLTC